ncbi:MAG: radical SAM protein [Spirochaetota bacterium]
MSSNKSLQKFQTASEIVYLNKNGDTIFFNAENVNPVYFPQGGDDAKSIIRSLKDKGSFTSESAATVCPAELFDFFLEHNIIVEKNQNFQNTVKKCDNCECGQKSVSRSMYLLLSHSCNQKCIYCLNGRETYNSDHGMMMTEGVAFKSVKTVYDSISPYGNLEIVFFGGEPLLNWSLAKKVIHYCEGILKPSSPDKKVNYHLTTNLTLFPDDLVEYALMYNITFLVNIDGPEEIHNKTRPFLNGSGSFKRSVENISRLNKAGISVALRATVTKYNQHRMLEVTRTHKDIGGAGSAFVPLNAIDSDEETLPADLCPDPKVFSKGLQDVYNSGIWETQNLYPFNEYTGRLVPGYRNTWACGAPHGNTPVITADGDIFSCIYLVGIERFKIGHINNNEFPFASVVNDMLEITNVNSSEECANCGFRYLCGGGCPVGRFTIAGNPNASEEIKLYTREISCAVSKTVLTELIWSFAKQKKDMLHLGRR